MLPERKRYSGFTLLEALIATVIIVMVSFAAAAFFSAARIGEIEEWQEQNALYLAEREIESWHGAGYNGLAGWSTSDVVNVSSMSSTTFLPYGYSFGSPDSAWNQTGRYKLITLDGLEYRVRAQLLYNASSPATSPTDFYILDTWNNGVGDVESRYRLIRVVIQWHNFQGFTSKHQLVQETRIAR